MSFLLRNLKKKNYSGKVARQLPQINPTPKNLARLKVVLGEYRTL